MLIAVGLAVGFRANVWNIGAEGQFTLGAICGGGIALGFPGSEQRLVLPAMIVAGALGGMAWAAIPALLRTRFNANEILMSADAGLRRHAARCRGWCTGRGAIPRASIFRRSRMFADAALLPILIDGTRLNVGLSDRARRRRRGWVSSCSGASSASRCASPVLRRRAAHYAGISAHAQCLARHADRRRRRRARRHRRGGGSDRTAAAVDVAGIRLRRDHRRLRRPPASDRHPAREPADVAALSRRRIGADVLTLPSAITGLFQGMLLFFLLASDVFINYRVARRARRVRRALARGGHERQLASHLEAIDHSRRSLR